MAEFAGQVVTVKCHEDNTEVKALVGTSKATIIDVNGTDSYNSGHVPGALNFDVVEANLAKVLPENNFGWVIGAVAGAAIYLVAMRLAGRGTAPAAVAHA